MAWVHVVMGSKSDKAVLGKSGFAKTLEEIIDPAEVRYSVCSAHRNARDLDEYVAKARGNGARIFVGIAGMAAALPGALAGLSDMTVPVIAVPLDEHGIDSCIYMPPGVPVLTAGVGEIGLKNAAIAVCQLVAIDPDRGGVRSQLHDYLARASAKKPPEYGIDPSA